MRGKVSKCTLHPGRLCPIRWEEDEDADDAASALFGDFFEETTLGLDRRRFEGLAFGLVLPTPTTVPLGLVLGFGATAKSDAA